MAFRVNKRMSPLPLENALACVPTLSVPCPPTVRTHAFASDERTSNTNSLTTRFLVRSDEEIMLFTRGM